MSKVKIQPGDHLLWDRESRMLADNSFRNLDMQNRISIATGVWGGKLGQTSFSPLCAITADRYMSPRRLRKPDISPLLV